MVVCKTLMQPAAALRRETPPGIEIHWDFAAGLERGCGSLQDMLLQQLLVGVAVP